MIERRTGQEQPGIDPKVVKAAGFAVDMDRVLFPQSPDALQGKNVTLKGTKNNFMLWKDASVRYATYLIDTIILGGKVPESVQGQVTEDEWQDFVEGQILAENKLVKMYHEVVFESIKDPDEWMTLGDASVEVEVPARVGRSVVGSLMACTNEFHKSNEEVQQMRSPEAYIYVKNESDYYDSAVSILNQVKEQGIEVNQLGLDVLARDNEIYKGNVRRFDTHLRKTQDSK